MGDFSNIINRLAVVRDYLVDAITDQGGTADYSMSFAELANQVYKIPTGMNEVRNAYQLFKENTTLTEFRRPKKKPCPAEQGVHTHGAVAFPTVQDGN